MIPLQLIPPHHWVRFTRYVVLNGYVIPDPNSTIRIYDPWKRFDSARQAGRPPAYESLLRLIHTAPGGRVPEPDLVRWCSRNGLVGTLLTDATKVYVAHDPEEIGDVSRADAGFIQYSYTSDGWIPTDLRDDPHQTGMRFKQSDRPAGSEPLARTWGEFFPGVAPSDKERQLYPIPSSHEFWRMYGERVDKFRDEAQWLLDAVKELPALVRQRRPAEALQASFLSARLQPSGPLPYRRWVRSLLSAYAAMIACDLLAGRRPVHCGKCGVPFLANAGAATCGYCP